MQPMRIDFARERGPWRWRWNLGAVRLGALLMLAAAAAGVMAWQRGASLQAEGEQARQTRLQLETSRESADRVARAQADVGVEEMQMLHQAALRRSMPWEAICAAFEAVPLVRMESFSPDLGAGVVKVQANAADVAALQRYLQALRVSPVFMRVGLLRHEALAGGGIKFDFEAVLAGPYRMPEPEPEEGA
jgi:hypothetical protein